VQPLDKTLRGKLEKAVKDARDIAEAAARATLDQLGVGEASPFAHLNEPERDLRRKLRAHGRQLGDLLNGGKVRTMDRLVEEVAYEHWHRMLFARFLAENNLLMYWPEGDEEPIDIPLETCQELIDEGTEKAGSLWELAARFAARMLPQIFRTGSPVFQLVLPPEHQQKLERLVAALPQEVFTASDSLGWVYQFWQAKKKDEVNASEVKIGARELPAVTQLFTEPYMVSFLLDNSLGAWWAARRLSESDMKNATSEEKLRSKAAIPGMPLGFLRFVRQENGTWTPAGGNVDGWPEHLSELKAIDPCCGSGHFLVAAFLMLVPIRMEREGLSARETVDAVLRENLHGLELDQRCVELAAFALALASWKYPGAGGYRPLPELNVACSGLAINAKKEDWLTLAGDNTNLRLVLEELYKQFKDAPVLGSLINPKASLGKGSLLEMKWEDVSPLLTKALSREKDDDKVEMRVVAQGLTKITKILTENYQWIMTNVPYRRKADLSPFLQKYFTTNFPRSKSALETVFLERWFESISKKGVFSVVIMQNWLLLKSYNKLRKKMLKTARWNLTSILGHGAFETISGEVVKVALLTLSKDKNIKDNFLGVDVSLCSGTERKASQLRYGELSLTSQKRQLGNPDFRITLEDINQESLLSEYVDSLQGLSTGDNPRLIYKFWEFPLLPIGISFEQGSVGRATHFSGREHCVKINDLKQHSKELGAALRGQKAWCNPGVSVDRMGDLSPTIYTGDFFDINVAILLPFNADHLLPVLCFSESEEFARLVRILDKKAGVTNATLGKVYFELSRWIKVASEKYPNGLPKPYSDDPTQWIFHGHPCGSVLWDEERKWPAQGPLRTDVTVMQVAVLRLLGYRWPTELNADMVLADEVRAWVKKSEVLLPLADEDGIVCIPPVRGEASASDRLFSLLTAAYGESWTNDTLPQLLKQADHVGKTLETWLREKFFTQHCKLFQHRPFIWHIWDGLRDGFAALVNYHKFDAKLLETLIYTYLGDWISRQKQDIGNSVDGAQEKLAAAEQLKKKLELILEGEMPYDLFVRWKAIEKQPLGWSPDLNDGVRLNIRPFMTVPDVGKKDAGVLRDKPNINWNKDRGKDVESSPWYPVFEGDRINEHHLTLEEKRAAREDAE
jgi:hypothetical protein